jgi:hypothetical protein
MLAQVKAKTLSRIRSGSRVRSGPSQITGLRHFPYPGTIELAGLGRVTAWVTGLGLVSTGLAGLSSAKAKTSPRAG